jgi:U2-associated protein SR140
VTQVVDIIVASLLVDGTPVPRKVARLYLICDILHNSAASIPNAWKFRQEFQTRLGLVFDHLSTIYHSFPGRITAESFKAQIIAVVEVWEDWIVFPAEHTSELRSRLDGSTDQDQDQDQIERDSRPQEQPSQPFTSRFKTSSFKPADEGPEAEEPSPDLDGEAMGEDVDGDPMEDIDVDGVPITMTEGPSADAENLDGDPMDDVDGDPMD